MRALIRAMVGTVILVLAASTTASAAPRSHEAWRRTVTLFGPAYTSPGFHTSSAYDSAMCDEATYGSGVAFSGYGFATAAIIDGSGNWNRSARSSSGVVYVAIDPNTVSHAISFNKKAYCANSGTGEQVIYMQCEWDFWENAYHTICV